MAYPVQVGKDAPVKFGDSSNGSRVVRLSHFVTNDVGVRWSSHKCLKCMHIVSTKSLGSIVFTFCSNHSLMQSSVHLYDYCVSYGIAYDWRSNTVYRNVKTFAVVTLFPK